MALDIGPGDEVILPSFTFFATASAITRLGARPIFADIEPETYNIDPVAVRRLVTRQTKALFPVHLFGQCADMEALAGIGRSEDRALSRTRPRPSAPSSTAGGPAPSATIGCLSFYPTKNLGGAGDGGMLTTSATTWPIACNCSAATACGRATITRSWASTAG